MNNINPTHTQAWKSLQTHFEKIKNIHISDLFNQDKNRFSNFSKIFEDYIFVDFSKNRISSETMIKLQALAEECNLKDAIRSMFNGEKININENRSVLHIALRNIQNTPIFVDGKNIMEKVNAVLAKMKLFCEQVISGTWKGYTGQSITDVVNIGIGGSDLGPYMVTEALRPYKNHLKIHFVSNIDGSHISEILKNLDSETTIFLIASKTFLTQETMSNAYSARTWFLNKSKDRKYISKHFFALSSNYKSVIKFGIDIKNIFELWDWVGGRYSLWSSIGLSIALSLGFKNFEKLLCGANAMDKHFSEIPFENNLPVLLALISIWYNNFFKFETEAILPYDQYMHRFVAYLQQINMESNGKSIDRNGKSVLYQTGPIIWGGEGSNGEHSFYQLLHQGTKIVPCDFIAPIISHNPLGDHHIKLLSHFFAQTEALAFGKSRKFVDNQFKNSSLSQEQLKKIALFKVFEGNRPTNSILLRAITPYSLGALISLYEHKIFTQGVILNICSFDQWGVELGKTISDRILKDILEEGEILSYSSSTNGLINCYKSWNDTNKNIN